MANSHSPDITRISAEGDSLSDRGFLWGDMLFGILRMSYLSGLEGKSPDHRFTNGYVWLDYLAVMYIVEFYLEESKNELARIKHHHKEKQSKPHELFAELKRFYDKHLEDPVFINWHKKLFLRSFAKGGTSSFKFSFEFFWSSFTKLFTRYILPALKTMRDYLIQDDKAKNFGKEEKQTGLIIEWTGANDMITVNSRPSEGAADLAVKARVKNAKKLIKHGYQHFVLFNLPDLSLTPRYAEKNIGKDEHDNAHACSEYFNNELTKKINETKKLYPQCNIDIFDIFSQMKDILDHASDYGFDPTKLTEFLTDDNTGYQLPKDGEKSVPSNGYPFYDSVHPSTQLHLILAEKAFAYLQQHYNVVDPGLKENISQKELDISESKLIQIFKKKYDYVFEKHSNRLFGASSNIYAMEQIGPLRLLDIFDNALNRGGKRTYKVLRSLGWLDEKGELYLDNVPALKNAYDRAIEVNVNKLHAGA